MQAGAPARARRVPQQGGMGERSRGRGPGLPHADLPALRAAGVPARLPGEPQGDREGPRHRRRQRRGVALHRVRRVRDRLSLQRDGLRPEGTPRREVRPLRGPALARPDDGLRQRLPDACHPLRAARRAARRGGARGPDAARPEPLPAGSRDDLPRARGRPGSRRRGKRSGAHGAGQRRASRVHGRASCPGDHGGSEAGVSLRAAARIGDRRPRGPGRLQHLLQLLLRELPFQGQRAGAHHRQRRRPAAAGARLPEVAVDAADVPQRAPPAASPEAGRRARREQVRAHFVGPGARRDRGEAETAARRARPRSARDVHRHAHRHARRPRLHAPLRPDVGHAEQGRHRSLLRRRQERRVRADAGPRRQRQQLHAERPRLGPALRLHGRQPGGNAPGLFRHDQRLAPAQRREDDHRGPAAVRHRRQVRPLARDPAGHRHGARPRVVPAHPRARAARRALLRRVAARFRGMARFHPGARLHAGVGRADYRHRRRRDPPPGGGDRRRRRLRDLREPRRQPAYQRHADQPGAHVPRRDHRQLGPARPTST